MEKLKLILVIIILLSAKPVVLQAALNNNIIVTDRYVYTIAKPSQLRVFTSNKGITVNHFIKKHKGIAAAINGTFFDKDSTGYYPAGLVISKGKLEWKPTVDVAAGKCRARHSAYLRNKARSDSKWFRVFYTTKEGTTEIITTGEFREKYNDKSFRSSIETAFEAGPVLVKNGTIQHEEFRNRPSRDKEVRRSVIGIMKDGSIIMLYTSKGYTLPGISQLLIGLGATDAINLDGGSSSSFGWPGGKARSVKVNTIFYIEN